MKPSEGKGIKEVCIAVDEVGTVYGNWLKEMPARIRNKYEYLFAPSQSDAIKVKDKLEKEGRKVFITNLYI